MNRTLLQIEKDRVVYENIQTAHQLFLLADYIILSLGVRNSDGLQRSVADQQAKSWSVGDAQKPGRIYDAIRLGYTQAAMVSLSNN